MRELSLFFDEFGSDNLLSSYYILAVVVHEQDELVNSYIADYHDDLVSRGLPNIPFHAGSLMNDNEKYRDISIEDRKKLFFCV